MDRRDTTGDIRRIDRFSRILLAAVCAFLCLTVAIGILIPTDDIRLSLIGAAQPTDFSTGWVDVGTGRPISSHPQLAPGETVTAERRLPFYIPAGYSIFYQVNNLYTRVSIDGCELHVSGQNAAPVFGRESGNVWSIFPLSSDCAGRTIRFTFTNKGIGRASVTRVLLGSESALAFYLLRSNAALIFACLLSLILGGLLIAYYHLLRARQVPFAYRQFLYLGLFIIDSALWCLTDSNLLQFVCGNASVRFLLSYGTFLLMPIPVILFSWEILEDYRRAYVVLLRVYLLSVAVMLTLYVTNLVHITRTIYVVHVFIVLIVAQTMACLIAEIVVHRKKKYVGSLVAFAIIGVAAAIGLYLYYNQSTSESYDNSAALRLGILIFALALLFTSVRNSLSDLKDIMFAQRYKELAYRDEVTGGSTIQKFRDSAAADPRWKKGGYAVLVINLLRFKLVNESLGREAADLELRRIYEALDGETAEDELLCRFTAEYILLIRAQDEAALRARYSRFIAATESEGKSAVSLFDLSCCACLIAGGEGDDIELLIDRARMAYRNPRAIRCDDGDLWIYTEGCREKLYRERQMESEAKAALKNGEFVVYIQPKISPAEGRLNGAEALVRWQKPDGTLIPPGEFVPLFERNGFITELDLYMFEQVCLLLRQWDEEGAALPVVSVNISKAALNRTDLMDRYAGIVERVRPPLSRLELEFTESMAYRDAGHMRDIISRIHSYGARCSIDDFGSAYSNMNALVRFDFDTVKLDKCFFDFGFPADEKSHKLVAGVIAMLKTLDKEIIAEGLETQEQVAAVAALGCDSVQGFYYSKPLPSEAFYRQYIRPAGAK